MHASTGVNASRALAHPLPPTPPSPDDDCRQCIEWVNLLCLTPFAFVAILGFLRGWNWMRLPAIIVSAFTFYSLILCIGTTLCVFVASTLALPELCGCGAAGWQSRSPPC